MPWGTNFLARLGGGTVSPRFEVRSIRPPYPVKPGGWIVTDDTRITLDPFVGTSVNTFTWAAQPGTFGFSIAGDTSQIRANMWRGQLVEITCSLDGGGVWEPIAIGAIWDVSGSVAGLRVECLDLLGAMRSRYTAEVGEQALFFDMGDAVSTDLAASFNFGTATTISVDDTTGFNSAGVLLLDHPNLTNGPFYVSYTGKTSNSFTGVSTTALYGSTGQPMPDGTATAASAIGDHPIDVVRQILTSTGQAYNGAYDVLAESFGYGFEDRHVDHHDCDRFKLHTTPASGSGDWVFLADAPQDSGYNWLQSVLQLGGFFLRIRQGRISVSGAQLLTIGTTTSALLNSVYSPSGLTITDDDLDPAQFPAWSAWDSNHTLEYATHRVRTATGHSDASEAITGLPAGVLWRDNLRDHVLENETNQRALLLLRLKQWRLRVPERLTISWTNPRLIQLAAGDAVRLNLNRAAGRLVSSARGYRDHWAMVVQNNPDWQRMRGTMTLVVPPDKGDDA